jgi:hypothetical protein
MEVPGGLIGMSLTVSSRRQGSNPARQDGLDRNSHPA